MQWWGTLISSLLFILAGSSVALPTEKNRHALVIGLWDYSQSPEVDSLIGPQNDVKLTVNALKMRLGVSDIVVLRNEQATHSAVKKSFADLSKRVNKGDFVYIFYSGHGSTLDDPDDPTGEDQTWVTFGSRNSRYGKLDELDVRDKEINYWLQSIYAKTDNVIVVSDSCHSATVARGDKIPVGTRSAIPDKRFSAAELLKLYPAIPGNPKNESSLPGVRIGSARDTESAIELDTVTGAQCSEALRENCAGVFTWNWVRALERAKPGDRWEDVFLRTFTWVTAQRSDGQRPQMEGHPKAGVFEGAPANQGTKIAVTEINASNGNAELGAGALDGVTTGSVYRFYDAQKPDRPDLPIVKIVAVAPFSSHGQVISGKVSTGDLLTESSHVYAFSPIHLFVSGDYADGIDKALVMKIQNAIKPFGGFELVPNRLKADWIVYVLRPEKSPQSDYVYSQHQRLPTSSPSAPPEVWVISPQEELLHKNMAISLLNPDAGIGALQRTLGKLASSWQLKWLETLDRRPPLSMQMGLLRPTTSCVSDCAYLADDVERKAPYARLGIYDFDHLPSHVQTNDVLTFKFTRNDDHMDWYIYILDIGPDGKVGRIFPISTANEDEARLYGGRPVDLGTKQVVRLDQKGVDTIKILASTKPIQVQLLEDPVGYKSRSAAELNPLERLLKIATAGQKSVENHEVGDWATQQADFAVGTNALQK